MLSISFDQLSISNFINDNFALVSIVQIFLFKHIIITQIPRYIAI